MASSRPKWPRLTVAANSSTGSTNPLQLDDRTGSGDLAVGLRSRGIPTLLTRLQYGDAAILGNGPDGCPTTVGVEIKQLSDVLQCIGDGRFAGHQLPGLVASYEYYWLVTEGIYRSNPHSGVLESYVRGKWVASGHGARSFMYRDLEHWWLTMAIRGGVRLVRTSNREETCDFLRNLYSWWTSKDWGDHKSHLAANTSHMPDRALLVRPSLARLVAKELPGIGWDRSKAVADVFPTVAELACADQSEWEAIPGIGPKTAAKVVRAIRTGKE